MLQQLKFIIIIFMCSGALQSKAQEYINPPGLDKFQGYWRHINGADTIMLQAVVRYIEYAPSKNLRAVSFYYSFKQASIYLYNNLPNSSNFQLTDFGGTKPNGSDLDTLEFGGRDQLKDKVVRGYVVINAAGNQLKYIRDMNVGGGGLYTPGLPGWTLPSGIVFTRYTIPPTSGD
jgi:hypothetical protein